MTNRDLVQYILIRQINILKHSLETRLVKKTTFLLPLLKAQLIETQLKICR